jgi:hypothetical protein
MTTRACAPILVLGSTVSTPNESPEPPVKGEPRVGTHLPNEGIREWFAREDWLLTEREVQFILTLRRSIAARYYNEWGIPNPGT